MWTLRDPDALCALLPHTGRMCLLEYVDDCSATRLRASTHSHRFADHPLAREGILASVHALEYGAQAIAIHAALAAREGGDSIGGGYLASARQLQLHRPRMDDLEATLQIDVERQFVQAGSLVYEFSVSGGNAPVADGIASVFAR